MRISDWSSDVCSSDLHRMGLRAARRPAAAAAIAGRRRPVARRARLLFRKPPRRDRQGEADAGLAAALSILSRGNEGGARLISCKGAKRAERAEIGRAPCRERVWKYVET